MTPPIDYKKIAHEFPQVPEWTKVVKWSPEDGCYVGYIEGPLGPCCHGDDPEAVREELAEIEREWRTLLGMPVTCFQSHVCLCVKPYNPSLNCVFSSDITLLRTGTRKNMLGAP